MYHVLIVEGLVAADDASADELSSLVSDEVILGLAQRLVSAQASFRLAAAFIEQVKAPVLC
jgi:hypothetical protein